MLGGQSRGFSNTCDSKYNLFNQPIKRLKAGNGKLITIVESAVWSSLCRLPSLPPHPGHIAYSSQWPITATDLSIFAAWDTCAWEGSQVPAPFSSSTPPSFSPGEGGWCRVVLVGGLPHGSSRLGFKIYCNICKSAPAGFLEFTHITLKLN